MDDRGRPDDRSTPPATNRWSRLGTIARTPVSARRLGRWLLVALAVLLPSVAFGVSTASAEGNLGPHVARYDMTLDERITVDLGPLGTLVLDSPLPLALGTRVVVQEIPRELTDLRGASTLDALGSDLERYVQFFSAPEATIEVAVRALVVDTARRALGAAVVIGGAVWLVRLALGRDRRRQLALSGRRHRGPLVGGTAVVVLVLGTITAGGTTPPSGRLEGPPSPVFAGTPLEGARITGRLAGILDTYGGQVVEAYRDNESFYDRAAAGLRTAWEEQAAADAEVAEVREAAGLLAVQDDDAPEPVTVLVVSDLHCNVGMARVIEAALEVTEADVLLNAGDTTMNGTPVESYCVTAFAQGVPAGVTTVVADGNHDSEDTAAQERGVGWTVLDGETVEIEGLRILGDADPRATRVGSGTVATEETVADLSTRLRDVACADADGVDLLLVHDVRAGQDALASGCAPAQVSGHYHRRIGPDVEGQGVVYVSSSTAGATLGQPTIGPLNGVAEMTVLRVDPEEGRILDYRLIRVDPEAEVTVGFPLRWPARPWEERAVPGPYDPR